MAAERLRFAGLQLGSVGAVVGHRDPHLTVGDEKLDLRRGATMDDGVGHDLAGQQLDDVDGGSRDAPSLERVAHETSRRTHSKWTPIERPPVRNGGGWFV